MPLSCAARTHTEGQTLPAPDPNLFAIVALIVWPAVALLLYRTRPIGQATLWTIVGAYLLLPVRTAIKFEMVPALDKSSLPNLAAFLGCLLAGRRVRLFDGFGRPELLILMVLASPFITSALNTDPVRIGANWRPGVGYYDALSAVIAQFLVFLPFLLGRQLLRSAEDSIDLLRVLAAAGLFYSLPMLFEMRMSPQLHAWIYGFFPHSFAQQFRDGGFRPVVFIGHGLGVAFFAMSALVASAALWRLGVPVMRLQGGIVTAYLGAVLVLCKSLGSLLYGAVAAPLARYAAPHVQLRIAVGLVSLSLLYPMLRAADLFPTTLIVGWARSVSDERADSLKFRFDQEQQLLDRAWERFAFGWGRYGRNRIFDEESGDDRSVTDGRWIATMGQFGFFGFLAEFGLLALPVFRAASAMKYASSEREAVPLAAVALLLALNVVDLLPNALVTPVTWLMAGMLLGYAEALRRNADRPETMRLAVEAEAGPQGAGPR